MHTVRAIFVMVLTSAALPALAQNRPPIARASVDADEVVVASPLQFRGSSSVDPDEGPEALTHSWDFGDGNQSTEPDPLHTYQATGVYDVALTVTDGAAQSIATVTVHVLDPVTDEQPSHSNTMAFASDGALWVVNADSGTVTLVNTGTSTVLGQVTVAAHPTSIAPVGDTLAVVSRDDGLVELVDVETRTVTERVAVGHRPRGVAPVGSSDAVLVTVEGADEVARVEGGEVSARLAVADGPHGVAVTADGSRAFVSHFISRGEAGRVTVIDLADFSVFAEVALVDDPGPDEVTSGRGIPNLLSTIAVEPSGRRVWVGGVKSNSNRGPFLSGEEFPFTNRVRGVMAPIATDSSTDLVDRRLDVNDADRVSGIVFSPTGRYAYTAHRGAGRVSIYDISLARQFSRGDADAVPFAARFDVGDAPTGLLLSEDGTRLYVHNELSRNVTVVDVTDPAAPVELAVVTTTTEPLPPQVALGKRLFNRSRDPVHSKDNYIACASCHPDGAADGRTWDFTQFGEGLRNTIDLRGRAGTAHGPVHWSANFDEIQDFENDIVNGFGGTGLAGDGQPPFHPLDGPPNAGRSAELDALAAYVASLVEFPPSPFRNPDGTLTDAAVRGKPIFEDEAVGCTECHAAPRYTDSVLTDDPADFVLHDVGTLDEGSGKRLGGALTGLDTPTLLGLWDGAPYLHDGRAQDLREVLVDHNRDDEHGATSHLSSREIDDLVAYLLQLDGRPQEIETPGDAGPGRDAGPDVGTFDSGGTFDRDGTSSDSGRSLDSPEGGCGCTTRSPRFDILFMLLFFFTCISFARHRNRATSRSGSRP